MTKTETETKTERYRYANMTKILKSLGQRE